MERAPNALPAQGVASGNSSNSQGSKLSPSAPVFAPGGSGSAPLTQGLKIRARGSWGPAAAQECLEKGLFSCELPVTHLLVWENLGFCLVPWYLLQGLGTLQRCGIGTSVIPHVPPLLQGWQEQILVLSVTPSPELPHSSCSQPVLALGTSPHLACIAGEGGMLLRGQLSAEGTQHGGQGTLPAPGTAEPGTSSCRDSRTRDNSCPGAIR